ncbi:efflux transporter outer membrane subunit [Dysgonomonas sp. BGC7]|uniref:efflux transporter outer membrane subunit n=1 Tax=Dysgonomonas sp. BGC7 TaxID=1658008 RepID=UPI00068264EA|nr:efflux transporter outer membrane subunit [Dysgonomonas sp. BGC7]MBD8388498.1 efflux transporter outer membrane subunit [Dysgonomonas sp. BGC7]
MIRKYIKGTILLGVILSMGFSSCQVVNKYKAPEIDSDALYRDEVSTDTTTIANIPWREYFTDPALQALIDEALNNNYDMLIVAQRVKQAEAALGMARAAYFPSLAVGGNLTHTRFSNGADGKKTLGYHTNEYMVGFTATWELDVWGKLNRQSRAKFADVLNSYAGRNLLQTSLISGIANSYYALLALDQQLEVTNEMIGLMQESVDAIEAMKTAGFQNRAAVEQMKASLYSAKVSIPDLESNIRQLENSICVMLGRKPGSIARTTIKDQVVPTQLAYGVPYQMLAKRPDVRQAELSFRSAFELTNAAQASFYPSISINSASLGYAGTLFKPENLAANIIGNIMQPIFAKKQLITQLKVAKAEQQAALLTFEKTVLEAGQEVSNIMYTYESSQKKNEVRSEQVTSLTQAVHDTKELLSAGEANYLEVINAQQSLLQAKLNQISDKLEQLQASSDLYRALGGGIE